jgi:hypothetical protein
MGTPMQQATIDAKNQAFDLYAQQIKAEEEAKRQAKEQKKQLMTMLKTAAISMVVGGVLKAGMSGAKTGIADAKLAKGGSLGLMDTFKAAGSGAFKGFGNMFGGIGDIFKGNFTTKDGGNPVGFSRIGSAMNQGYTPMGRFAGSSSGFASNLSAPLAPSAAKAASYNNTPIVGGENLELPTQGIINDSDYYNKYRVLPVRATGGQIPNSAGVDTIPAMLSGGEFVMNNAATKNIGTGNLSALNSGASSLVTEEKSEQLNQNIIDKLDELIEASLNTGDINITVNNGKTEGGNQDQSSDDNGGQNMARKIRDAVLRVIEEEKRLGGTLRRGLA